MAELKPFEVIMKIDFGANDGVAVVAHAKKVSELVRCGECKHCFVDGANVRYNVCELNHNKVQGDNWFCADGERLETPNIPTEIINSVLGEDE